ncbi:hypothetical protein OIU74_026442 [Salix koriyanagi]|uniref:F-box domain-containing protein n=1 Tax=Salix koriyanagi TaxID=2511006 RepID=A0A9Q0W176_9ROSI|nr:hypothetical protein OIU74_026442 [Salix koriyanagi]
MDSHVLLEAFTCRDTVIMIFRKLGARDLARASCVCKLWRDMASGDEIVRSAFMEPWKLKEIVGKPKSGRFWRDSGIYLEVQKGWFLVCGYLGICFFFLVDLDKVEFVVYGMPVIRFSSL